MYDQLFLRMPIYFFMFSAINNNKKLTTLHTRAPKRQKTDRVLFYLSFVNQLHVNNSYLEKDSNQEPISVSQKYILLHGGNRTRNRLFRDGSLGTKPQRQVTEMQYLHNLSSKYFRGCRAYLPKKKKQLQRFFAKENQIEIEKKKKLFLKTIITKLLKN